MRRPANTHAREVVRISVPLPASDWAKLCTAAAIRQQDRGQVAAEILHRGLRSVICRDGPEILSEIESPPSG